MLGGRVSRAELERALLAVGFRRDRDRFVHHGTRYYIEFPRGPLAIGCDVGVRPVEVRVGSRVFLALSPTDSCRDRLAAFYFWADRQSLRVAVSIARRNEIDLALIRRWSRAEGHSEDFEEFVRHVRSESSHARRENRGSTQTTPPNRP